ncbi:S41 family peptidase [Methylosinus sp. Ce-a6]|uniref:S41 family peptidase n=1 Tax=Methylosinus sp. Ce-a6 TaxID=2172005 RepID=UPI001356D1FB|nr:S41 family peptidase [Methylosinus sp. Ce-a6]
MMRKASLIITGIVIGAGCATLGQQARVLIGSPAFAAAADTYKNLSLFGDVFDKVRADYVEKPDEQKLVESAINGMLTSLDPHSSYLDAKGFKDMRTQTEGKFGGLGIEVTQEDGLVKVVTPIDDTPASRAGVMSGDLIFAIDDENVQGLTLNQAVDKMRGQINTAVKLTILRGKDKEKIEVKLVRAEIHIKSVRSHKEGDDIGYIRISQFNEETSDGLRTAIQKFQQELPGDKLKGYVLDLRNNPGGLLDQSIQVVNSFIDHGEIVSTRGRTADETQRYNARAAGDISRGKPVVVLINGGSASASEIVAGALQDHKRATILGTRSFGKGSVQTIIPLGGNNGALRLTTARYYTPSGRSIQAKGIDPDVLLLQDVPDELKGKDDTKGEAALKGHLKNGEDEKSGSQAYVPPDPKKDKQLTAAVDILHGKFKPQSAAEQSKPSESSKSKVSN